jgi:glyoxylase-like metal-dependent hydrolase (beta-lactamase superfamily II)
MAIEVADGVFQLAPLPYVNVVAVRGGNGWTVVDASLAATAERLVRGLAKLGIRTGDVERVVLTHGHVDHAGGAERVRAAFGAREVLVGAADLDDVRAGNNASGDPGSPLERSPLPSPGYPGVPSAQPLADVLALDDDRDLVVVPTPGHTDGHVSFHLPDSDVMLGGDTVFNVFRLTPSPGFLCSDAAQNLASILRLAELDPSVLLLAHGDPVTDDVAGRLRTLARA